MRLQRGDVVLVPFPFTDLTRHEAPLEDQAAVRDRDFRCGLDDHHMREFQKTKNEYKKLWRKTLCTLNKNKKAATRRLMAMVIIRKQSDRRMIV